MACVRVVLLFFMHSALFFLVHRPLMSHIMAVMDQKDNYDNSFAVQRQSPWSRQFVRPGISQLQYTMADVSVVQVVQVLFPVVAQRQSPWSKLCPCCACRASSLPYRDAEVVSHGQACLADHRDFAVAVRAGWSMFLMCGSSKSREACSGCAVRAVYTGTRPGLTPAIRAGKGWRGRGELAPRCSATRISCT